MRKGKGHPLPTGSQLTDADAAEFARLRAGGDATARQAFLFIIGKHHKGKDGKPLPVAEDMRQHPEAYGFASSADAAAWQGSVELAD